MSRTFLVLFLAALASAEVVDKNANGLEVRHKTTVAANPADAFRGIVAVGNWWDTTVVLTLRADVACGLCAQTTTKTRRTAISWR